MKTWKDVEARWAKEVGEALGFTDDTLLLAMEQEIDYQGHCNFVAQPKKNEIVVYGWYYGSCSGCDPWEDNENEIEHDVQKHAARMTVPQFRKHAERVRQTAGLPGGSDAPLGMADVVLAAVLNIKE